MNIRQWLCILPITIWPLTTPAEDEQLRSRALEEMKSFARALDIYWYTYGQYPFPQNDLRNVYVALNRGNDRRLTFFTTTNFTEHEEFADPWGSPYHLGHNEDGGVTVSSWGPNRTPDDQDDIRYTNAPPERYIPDPRNAALLLVTSDYFLWRYDDTTKHSQSIIQTRFQKYYLQTQLDRPARCAYETGRRRGDPQTITGISPLGSLLFADNTFVLMAEDMPTILPNKRVRLFNYEKRDLPRYEFRYPPPDSGGTLVVIPKDNKGNVRHVAISVRPDSNSRIWKPFWPWSNDPSEIDRPSNLWPCARIDDGGITIWNGHSWTNASWQIGPHHNPSATNEAAKEEITAIIR